MYAEERRRQIASLTAIEGRVNVTELADKFDVTAETIRRDLAVLNREGLIHRCLLYTSPSPRDRQKSRMPSSA